MQFSHTNKRQWLRLIRNCTQRKLTPLNSNTKAPITLIYAFFTTKNGCRGYFCILSSTKLESMLSAGFLCDAIFFCEGFLMCEERYWWEICGRFLSLFVPSAALVIIIIKRRAHIMHYAHSFVYSREDIGLLTKGCVRVERSGKFAQALPYPSSGVMRTALMSFLSAQPV